MPNLYTKPISKYLAGTRVRNLLGLTFTRLFVLQYIGRNRHRDPVWTCLCDCGNIREVSGHHLRRGQTNSCGCFRRDRAIEASLKHGHARMGKLTPEYHSYNGANRRCNNKNNPKYPRYGGRGIEFRFASFQEFYNHIGPKPEGKYTLGRKKNDGHYEIGNVGWETPKEQMNNTDSNAIFIINNVARTMTQWSEISGRKVRTIHMRRKYGWCDSCAVHNPIRQGCSHC